jgi:hypothetical protein
MQEKEFTGCPHKVQGRAGFRDSGPLLWFLEFPWPDEQPELAVPLADGSFGNVQNKGNAATDLKQAARLSQTKKWRRGAESNRR